MLPRKDLFQDRDELTRDRLYGRLEGMLIGLHLSNEASLQKAYDMVNVPYPDDITELVELAQKKNESTAGKSFASLGASSTELDRTHLDVCLHSLTLSCSFLSWQEHRGLG